MRTSLTTALLHTVMLGVLGGAPAGKTSSFEVASIKPSRPPEPNQFGFPVGASIRIGPGGRMNATQATLRDLVRRAYDVPDVLVVGLRGWMTSDRFDIIARPQASFAGSLEQIHYMLRDLLAERFKLRAHTEPREIPVYHLEMVRRDQWLGTELRPSTLDCEATRRRRAPAATSDGSEPACRPLFKVGSGTMTLRFQGETLAEFARRLVPGRDRPILDNTGLSGTFDGELTFAPEPPPGFPRVPGSENGISIFTALQEQLGLKLVPAKDVVNVLVIDGAEKPPD